MLRGLAVLIGSIALVGFSLLLTMFAHGYSDQVVHDTWYKPRVVAGTHVYHHGQSADLAVDGLAVLGFAVCAGLIVIAVNAIWHEVR